MRKELIIVADDYGIRGASAPILRLAREGIVDRVAVLAHFVSAEDVLALKETGVSIDIHLELISAKVKRAAELMDFCKKQLHELDEELEKMIEELDNI